MITEDAAYMQQEEPVWCDLHERRDCLLCDECGHDEHLWAPAYEASAPEASRFIYDHATCWAENICRECSPALHARALELVAQAPTEAEARVLDGNR